MIVDKNKVIEMISDDAYLCELKYEILKTNHAIEIDSNGVLRWVEEPGFRKNLGSLNNVVIDLYNNGFSKNSEQFRSIYRKIGYSLWGYWEVFYWDINNSAADDYI